MRGAVRDIMTSLTTDSGGNVQEAQKNFTKMFDELVDEKKIVPEQISIRELFDVLANPKGQVNLDNSVEIQEAVTTSAFPYVTSKLISSKVLEDYEYNIGATKELSFEYKMSRDVEDIAGFIDLDTPDRVLESMPYHEQTIDEKRVTLKARKFGRIISLTREMILFDQTGKIVFEASRLGEKMAVLESNSVLRACTDVADSKLGIAAAEWLIYDGTARDSYSSDHSAWDDGANANDNASSTTTLGSAGLKTAFTMLRKLKDNQDEYINVRPTHLLVAPTKEWDALELITSDKQFDSAENAKNVFQGMGIKIISHPLFADTSSYYWYLGDFKKDIWLGRVWPVQITAQKGDSEAAFSSDIIQRYKVSNYFGVNAVDYRHRLLMAATT